MAFITRLLLCAGVVLGACAGQPDATECVSGITCPEGTKCAAAQMVCIINDCGDGIVQTSEICDDGNIVDGDGCAKDCLSSEVCGDMVLNSAAGELCDDGNTTGGDGCADDCRSVEICGNGVRDVQEACDDGNTVPGDGCSGNCKSTEICGNSIVDLAEKCDDGGAAGGCNDDCQGGTGCGDGAIDRDGSGTALEECDDGNTDDQDDCTNACNLNQCGDGIVQLSGARIEFCDPSAGFGETADCNVDCTEAMCGDNKINNERGEQCDEGAGLNGDDRVCTAACKVGVCGDGLHRTMGANPEDCDDMNTSQTDGCSTLCTSPTCGNGVIEMGEACDDGNTADGDGCWGLHTVLSGLPSCQFENCGDGEVNNGEDCDDGGESVDCNLDCTHSVCRDGKVNGTDGEECDDNNAVDTDTCRNNCELPRCGDNVVSPGEACDDGDADNTDGCTTSCTVPSCSPPNGIVDMGEQCDDGNLIDTDGCISTCMYATCGDGEVQNGVEECDDGVSNNGDARNCLATCKLNTCGDTFVDLESSRVEECDLGAFNDQTTCPYGVATCTLCLSSCTDEDPGVGPFCGDGITQSSFGEACDDRSTTQSCGQCDNACNTFTAAAAATALIIATDSSNSNIPDTARFALDDGFNVAVTFEFDRDVMPTFTAGNIRIDVSGTTVSATTVRERIQNAINSTSGLRITSTDLGANGLLLTHDQLTVIGNRTISSTGFGGSSDFFISSAMAGGAAGNCTAGVPCRADEDCLSSSGNATGTCHSTNKVCL